jgi:hypothetical protein
VNNTYPDLDHVLIYDKEGTAASPANIAINGSSSSSFAGAMYFPNGNVTWAGNAPSVTSCTEIIANTLDIEGNSNLQVSGCPVGIVPKSQIVLMTS